MFYQNGVFRKERMSRIVDARNFARVHGYLNEAVSRGARIVKGGGADEADFTIEPRIIVDPPLDAGLMRDEIFGTVLPVITYDPLDEVVDQVDVNGKPLAMYVFSRDQAFVNDVLERTSSGGVTMNYVLMHYAEHRLRFGGVNDSGMGRYQSVYGFRELSNARSVFVAEA